MPILLDIIMISFLFFSYCHQIVPAIVDLAIKIGKKCDLSHQMDSIYARLAFLLFSTSILEQYRFCLVLPQHSSNGGNF